MSDPIFLISILLSLVFASCSAQSCSNYRFPNNQTYKSCMDLPVLNAHLHWNYINTTTSVEMAYRANQTSSGWIAWAINPTKMDMVGSQALVAFHDSNGSMIAYTTPVNSYSPSMQPGNLSFHVSDISATYFNNEMIIFALVGPLQNGTTINHVWQAGDSVSNNMPMMHATSGEHLQSMGTINFLSP